MRIIRMIIAALILTGLALPLASSAAAFPSAPAQAQPQPVNWEGEPALRFPLPTLAPKVRARSSLSRTDLLIGTATKGATPPWNPLERLPVASHGARLPLIKNKREFDGPSPSSYNPGK
jgi:hypothetical protein